MRISDASTADVVSQRMLTSAGSSRPPTRVTPVAKSSEGVVIDSYQRTVGSIGLNSGTQLTGTGASTAYTCIGTTNEQCLVDYAQAGAVENLLTGDTTQSIDPGTYSFALVANCAGDVAPGPTYVKARARFNGTWWYTTAATGVTTPYLANSGIPETAQWVDPADYDLATQPPSPGCATYNVFASPVTIAQGEAMDMKLFFELRGLLRIDTTATTLGGGGCFAPADATTDGSAPYLCSTMPYLAGSIESAPPDLQRYLVTRGAADTASAMVYGFYLRAGSTEPLGAYSYQFFDDTYVYPSAWSEVVKRLRATSPGVLTVVNYGKSGEDPNSISDAPGGFNTTSFTLLGAVGESGTVSYTDAAGQDGTVTIRRLE